MGGAARFDVIGATEPIGAPRATRRICRSAERGGINGFASNVFASDRAARSCGDSLALSRSGADAPGDSARSGEAGPTDRGTQHPSGTDGRRECEARRATYGEPGPVG